MHKSGTLLKFSPLIRLSARERISAAALFVNVSVRVFSAGTPFESK